MTRCLVTGGAGFIGSHLVHRLVARGWKVRVLDNLSTGSLSNLLDVAGRVEFFEGDITRPLTAARAVDGVEVVFHQAALASVPLSIERPIDVHRVCATGTLNLLDASRRAGILRFVYAASSSAYGDSPEPLKSESQRPSVLSPYAAAKLAGELYAESFAHSYGLETVRLRYFNVFGPRQDPGSPYSAVIPLFASALAAGKRPRIYGTGEQSRDFVSVHNVAEANLLAAVAKGAAGNVYNIGSGHSITVNELLRRICERMDVPFDPEYLPARAGDVLHSAADISAAERDLGYRPAVDFEAALAETVDYYVAAGERRGAATFV
ncbi:MAG: SDR family oxidoreductase [Planctomyces sp.]|nr:SDR family oxidoreductase [Planctomyces sp.]